MELKNFVEKHKKGLTITAIVVSVAVLAAGTVVAVDKFKKAKILEDAFKTDKELLKTLEKTHFYGLTPDKAGDFKMTIHSQNGGQEAVVDPIAVVAFVKD